MEGSYFQLRTASSADWRRAAGPDTTFGLLTFPALSITTSSVTSPSVRASRATIGYAGKVRLNSLGSLIRPPTGTGTLLAADPETRKAEGEEGAVPGKKLRSAKGATLEAMLPICVSLTCELIIGASMEAGKRRGAAIGFERVLRTVF